MTVQMRRATPRAIAPHLERAASWHDLAACKGTDPELFFASAKAQDGRITQALAICDGCPVMEQCLEDATRQAALNGGASGHYGIRGGLTENQVRAQIAKRIRTS